MTEFRGSKIIQKITLNTYKRCFVGKGLKKHLRFKKWHNFALQLFYAKNGSKHTWYSRNDIILKIGHLAKAIAKVNGQ